MKKIVITLFTTVLSVISLTVPNGVAPIAEGYNHDSDIVSFSTSNNIEKTQMVLQGATKNWWGYNKPTEDKSVNPSDYTKVEVVENEDSLDWTVTFDESHHNTGFDRVNLSIILSKNLEIIGDMKYEASASRLERTVFTNFKAFVEDYKKSLVHYLPNNLSAEKIAALDKGKPTNQQIGNGIFFLDFKSGSKDNFNKLGRSVGKIYYFKDWKAGFLHDKFIIKFKTNKIDPNQIRSGTEAQYFVEATLKSRQGAGNDYVFGQMLLFTIKNKVNNDKYLQVKNNFYGMEDENASVNMTLNLNGDNKNYTFNYSGITSDNNKFSKNFLISPLTFNDSNISFNSSNNLIVKKQNIVPISNGYTVSVDYYNIGEYNYLNNAQKKRIEDSLRNIANSSSPNKEEFIRQRKEASNLEKAMKKLQEEVSKEGVKNTNKYINSDIEKKNAYDQSLEVSKNVLNKQSGTDYSLNSVETLYENLKNSRNELNGQDELSLDRQNSNSKIDELENLNTAQKENFKNRIESVTTKEEIPSILNEAKELDKSMDKLGKVVDKTSELKDLIEYINDTSGKKAQLESLVNEANSLLSENGEYKDNQYITNLIDRINEKYEEFKNMSLVKYVDTAKKFYDIDTDIATNFDKTIYLNTDLQTKILEIINDLSDGSKLEFKHFPAKLEFGFNFPVSKNGKLGAFAEYKRRYDANIFGVGVNTKYSFDNHNIDSFIRYRMINYDNLKNHNVDLYLRYAYNISIGNFSFIPHLGAFLTYSHRMLLDSDVVLASRFTALLDNTETISYYFPSADGKLYLNANFKVGMNTRQKLYRISNNENIKYVNYDFYQIKGTLGYEQNIKDFKIDTSVSLDNKYNLDLKVGASYNKKW